MNDCDVTELSELWVPAYGYEGLYEVSSFGRVRSVARIVAGRWGDTARQGRLLQPARANGRYLKVTLYLSGVGYQIQVHTLVLQSFIGAAPEGFNADHIDFDITNNALHNLRWVHAIDNIRRRRNAKLTRGTATALLDRAASGTTRAELAAAFGISERHVQQVVAGTRWKD
jgi:hypothetical protein